MVVVVAARGGWVGGVGKGGAGPGGGLDSFYEKYLLLGVLVNYKFLVSSLIYSLTAPGQREMRVI